MFQHKFKQTRRLRLYETEGQPSRKTCDKPEILIYTGKKLLQVKGIRKNIEKPDRNWIYRQRTSGNLKGTGKGLNCLQVFFSFLHQFP